MKATSITWVAMTKTLLIFFGPPGETRATALPAVASCIDEAKCFF
jgi:hypothetical protein